MMVFGFFFTLVYSICRGVLLLVAATVKIVGKVLMYVTGFGHQKEDSHRL